MVNNKAIKNAFNHNIPCKIDKVKLRKSHNPNFLIFLVLGLNKKRFF